MELLLVMGLLALLMGAGVGMLSSINLGQRAAVGLVQSVVRAAHNSAVARNAPARVRIDVPTGTMRAEAMAVIGTWHFESERLEGAFEINGVLESGSIVDDGYIGRALTFSPTAGRTPAAEFPVHQDASYDLSLGFAIECVVRVDGNGGGRLLRMGDTVGIDVTTGHGVKAWFVPEIVDTSGSTVRGGKVVYESVPGVLAVGRWTRVRVQYDRRRLVLEIDGVEAQHPDVRNVAKPSDKEAAAQKKNPPANPTVDEDYARDIAPVWRVEGPLVLGEASQSFACSLDNLVISSVSASQDIRLPETVRFAADTIPEIQFDAGGDLDRAVHDGPVSVWLEFEDGARVEIGVGMYGTVD
jgi:hypothetical protein